MPDDAPEEGSPVPAERLAEVLAVGLAPATAERLLASPRLGARARTWIASLTFNSFNELPGADRALAEAGRDGLWRAASLAGAVWHSTRVRGLMLARDLQPFIEAHGPGARRTAMRHASLAPKAPDTPGEAPLADQVRESGLACVTAWIEALPPKAARTVRLAWPADNERVPEDAHRAHGPAILRAVAADLGPEPVGVK